LIGGSGAFKTPTLAGRHADEFNLYHHDPDGIAERIAVMRRAAEEAGRDPDGILISTCLPMIGGDSETELLEVAAGLAARSGADPEDLLTRYRERGIQVGSWRQHRDWLERMREAGIERTYLQLAASVDWHLEKALKELT
jgi:alkanesulfonate monooxygenase SsuD/methylene tetrahydromethanopterin reductase-like flavin-dependent oxidoreductase (luciferase family)